MFAKIRITGTIEVMTGLHIGGNSLFSAIGAVDSPVIKDMRTELPMIPGSSLKGKMRALLAKCHNTELAANPDDDNEDLTKLFGCAKKGNVKTSRVLFSDMFLGNWEELKKQGLTSRTEIKFENSIKRTTAVAKPRQIERVVRGSEFPMEIIYEVRPNNTEDILTTVQKDFKLLGEGFRLLEYDYLGGNGSRGYGKIKFRDLTAKVVIGEVSDEIMNVCRDMLSGI